MILEMFPDDFGQGIMPYQLPTETFRARLFFHRSLEGATILATAYILEFQ